MQRIADLNLDWFRENLVESKARVFDFPLEIAKKRGARILLEDRKIKVGTIHSFKGDEADLCILFPDLSARGFNEWWSDAGRPAILRQYYVAFTRTRDELIICDPASGQAVKI